ncbi:MAG: hypothetical protein CMH54_05985 [Myxococcales bacterium]|nr:hypothetical protein [Myxococcales bacterium]|tara:strand:+ start:810 stop:2243 length:1434 start_codon:yes stop_codon:yes gene_type:complete
MEKLVLGAGLFVFTAHLLDVVFKKTRIPDILLLMILGVLAGPCFEWLDYREFGTMWPLLGAITLVVILFESGLSLPLGSLLKAAGRAVPFALLTFSLTVSLLTVVCALILGLWGWEAVMAGFILGGTSSAVVIPIVKGLGCSESTASILTLESAITDVLCIIGTVGIATGIAGEAAVNTEKLVEHAALSFALALVFGIVAGLLWSFILGLMRRVDNAMFTTLAYAMVVYGSAEMMGISGAIAALSLGITMGNVGKQTESAADRDDLEEEDSQASEEIEEVNEPEEQKPSGFGLSRLSDTERVAYREVVFLLKALFFFFLGLTVAPSSFLSRPGLCALILAPLPLIPRIIPVRWVFPRKAPLSEALLAWAMVPRGLAAVVLATVPLSLGLEGAELIKDTVALTVFLNITLVAVLVFLIERGFLDEFGAGMFPKFQTESSSAPLETPVPEIEYPPEIELPQEPEANAPDVELEIDTDEI